MSFEHSEIDGPGEPTEESTAPTSEAQAPISPLPQEPPLSTEEKPRRRRGFAAMDPKLVSELATRGGKAAHRAGTAHEFSSEEARIAGRKGGMATHAKRRAKLNGGGTTPVS
jgi:general stress protein YciG